ncbi:MULTISPECIES: sensor histidine kinase [Prauserella salsuginis group]|uniref:Sensor histidine kinase n=1 Tax=Prauserella salsuginis TaxID=387889 RepID=A0ABW6G6Q5_9PSEU|nr:MULTISPECIES: histidine kinase [Prauserella salsuginis group]MCR3722728.1 Signal transduction histidine kinase [Prauserella flava]MCR3737217.1 Signal transduction histidine kinase [Prauserella salsuginis]
MGKERLEVAVATAGLAIYLVIGLPIIVVAVSGDAAEPVTRGPFWLWLVCYAGFLVAFAATAVTGERGHRGGAAGGALLTMVCGAGVVLLSGDRGVTPILLVFAAAIAAQYVSARMAVGIVAGNTVVVAAAGLWHGTGALDLLLTTCLYGVLQVLYLFTTWAAQREQEANERLAVAHAELRSATALLAESSQSQERLRIARELHDLLGHKLSALALQLETASHRVTGPAGEDVERARLLAKELLTDVRSTVGELRSRPPELRAALETVVRELPRPRGHLTVAEDVEVDEQRITVLVRCTQEIVTNAIRHSDADNLWLDVRARPGGGVLLRARDDGRGTSALRLGHGLTGLTERAEELGGSVTFDGLDGFAVEVDLPSSAVPVAAS